MESYPLEYVLHHVPLMAVMGLIEPDIEPPNGPTDTPTSSSLKKVLLSVLMAKNNMSIWDAAAKREGFSAFFHVTVLDKAHVFPPRKLQRATPVQHSNLSPLTPGSPLYPDGLMLPAWIQRQKETRPAIVVGFYILWERAETLDNRDPLGVQQAMSIERERDLILCAEINEKKRNATDRGIRFAVVLILKMNPADDPHLDERVSFIRRTCGLDLKSSLFVLPSASADPQQFITMMQKSLHDTAGSYYRDHDKRIRKKKARLPPISARAVSTVPSTSAASLPGVASISSAQQAKPLPPAGWHLRYEYKLAVFAEFRQDMENAIKHYETAYQLLIELFQCAIYGGALVPGGGGSAPNDLLQPFTSRWLEARTLVDCINLKICKLHLYTDRPVPALQQLEKHLTNCKSFPEFVGPPSTELTFEVSPGLTHLANLAGGGSFEYWTWVSTQYRVFGELIELATGKIGLRLPFPPPGSLPAAHTATGQAQSFLNTLSNNSMNVLSGGDVPVAVFGPFSATNASLVVQHAGYYYFLAARCAEERWKRFAGTEKAITSAPPPPPSAATSIRGGQARLGSFAEISGSPFSALMPSSPMHAHNLGVSLASERSVDHATLVIELLTRSYEQFKKHRAGRMTLFLASEIARVYEQSGKYEMALKFFERIGKTYRKEHWPNVLKDVLKWSVQCARTLGRWDVVVECLVELMSERMAGGADGNAEQEAVVQELMTILRGDGQDMTKGLRVAVDMDQIDGFLQCNVQFKKHSTYVGVSAPFQVVLTAASARSPPIALRISKIHIGFSDARFDHVILDLGNGGSSLSSSGRRVKWLDITNCERKTLEGDDGHEVWTKKVDLEVLPGMTQVLEGVVIPGEGLDLKLLTVSVVLAAADGQVSLNFNLSERGEDTSTRRKWCVTDGAESIPRWVMLDGYGEQAALRVIRRQPNLSIQLTHAPPGYIDEVYWVVVEVVNEEKEEIEAYIDLEFRSSGTDGADPTSHITQSFEDIAGEASSPAQPAGSDRNAISAIRLGVIPSLCRVSQRFWLRCRQNAGERVMYNTVYYRATSSSTLSNTLEAPQPSSHPDLFFRKNESIRLNFIKGFETKFSINPEYGMPFEATEAGLLSLQDADGSLELVEKHTIVAAVKCVGPWDVEVAEVKFIPTNVEAQHPGIRSVQVETINTLSTAANSIEGWKSGHVWNGAYHAMVAVDPGAEVEAVPVGDMVVRWRRRQTGDIEPAWAQTVLTMPDVPLQHRDISICVDIPPLLHHTTPFTVTYELHNTSLAIHHLSLSMEVTEGFVFSGYKQTHARMLPLSTMRVTYNCVPMVCGKAALPRLKVMVIPEGAEEKEASPREVKNVHVRGGVEAGLGPAGELMVFVRPRSGQLLERPSADTIPWACQHR
ncbi:hypothetical protein SpCBS45565_g00138 [Spizellomyces sp. 'palustris']|nr:hypothetical protein SpCBS45565_g00138 [Spizellomyces sp. 'palustris']